MSGKKLTPDRRETVAFMHILTDRRVHSSCFFTFGAMIHLIISLWKCTIKRKHHVSRSPRRGPRIRIMSINRASANIYETGQIFFESNAFRPPGRADILFPLEARSLMVNFRIRPCGTGRKVVKNDRPLFPYSHDQLNSSGCTLLICVVYRIQSTFPLSGKVGRPSQGLPFSWST